MTKVQCVARKKISDKTITEVLVRSRRRCAMCFGLERDFDIKDGQIAHVDHNHANPELANLVFLCLRHHNEYDSRKSQAKNFIAEELMTYREELYREIERRFHMAADALKDADFRPDRFDGTYEFKLAHKEATLEIRHIKDNVYTINGTSFFGTDRPGGPNIGELSEVATMNDGVLIYADFNPDTKEVDYTIRIVFDGNKIHVDDTGTADGLTNRFGMGAYFAGDYEKISG